MRINEIITELNPSTKQIGRDVVGGVGKLAGAAAGGIVGAGKASVKGFQAGQAAMDKLLTPSQWFTGTDKEKSQPAEPNVLQVRDSLKAAAQGLPLNASDSKNLNRIRQDIHNGRLASNDAENEMAVLQAAAQGHKLNPDQIKLIKNIHNRY